VLRLLRDQRENPGLNKTASRSHLCLFVLSLIFSARGSDEILYFYGRMTSINYGDTMVWSDDQEPSDNVIYYITRASSQLVFPITRIQRLHMPATHA
jgi:hypothetical protein